VVRPASAGHRVLPVRSLRNATGFLFSRPSFPRLLAVPALARRFSPVLAGCALALGACERAPRAGASDEGADAALTVFDDAGREVRLRSPAHRIISLVPARTEAILALGAADWLIARTEYDLDPRVAALPSVGNALNPSVEWLVAQQPDLVIAWADGEARSIVERLTMIGVTVYATRVETLDQLDKSIRDLGTLLGLSTRADSLRWSIADTLGAVRRRVAGEVPVRVLYLVGLDPPLAAGPRTFVHDVIEAAGGANVFGDLAHAWPSISVEEVLRRDPDVIIVSTSQPAADATSRFAGRPGWRELRAVRSGAVHDVDADLFNRVGPRVGLAASHLAALLHPPR
jgi:iron complex transport system substrate-binding protein